MTIDNSMKIDIIGTYATLHQRETDTGWCVEVFSIDAPERTSCPFKHRVYRKSFLANPQHWATKGRGRKILEKFWTKYVGQLLVTDCRNAMRLGEVTKAQLQKIKIAATQRYGHGLYSSRKYQDYCARALFAITDNMLLHWETDAWLPETETDYRDAAKSVEVLIKQRG